MNITIKDCQRAIALSDDLYTYRKIADDLREAFASDQGRVIVKIDHGDIPSFAVDTEALFRFLETQAEGAVRQLVAMGVLPDEGDDVEIDYEIDIKKDLRDKK